MERMPERINVLKVISYDTEGLLATLADIYGPDYEITYADVFELASEYAWEDFQSVRPRELIFQDENGTELHSDSYGD
jgi:hypothetical protein